MYMSSLYMYMGLSAIFFYLTLGETARPISMNLAGMADLGCSSALTKLSLSQNACIT